MLIHDGILFILISMADLKNYIKLKKSNQVSEDILFNPHTLYFKYLPFYQGLVKIRIWNYVWIKLLILNWLILFVWRKMGILKYHSNQKKLFIQKKYRNLYYLLWFGKQGKSAGDFSEQNPNDEDMANYHWNKLHNLLTYSDMLKSQYIS